MGESIRARRLQLRQTPLELARRARLSEARIAAVEAGDPDVDLLQLVAIAEALETPLRRLLQRAERQVGWRARRKERGGGLPRGGPSSIKKGSPKAGAKSAGMSDPRASPSAKGPRGMQVSAGPKPRRRPKAR